MKKDVLLLFFMMYRQKSVYTLMEEFVYILLFFTSTVLYLFYDNYLIILTPTDMTRIWLKVIK